MAEPPPSPRRPALVTFHCGVFFAIFAMWFLAIARKDIQAHYGDRFIGQSLLLMGLAFVGYLGVWNLRRWGIALVGVAGALLLVWGLWIGFYGLPVFLPLIAALTLAPLWPLFRR